MVLLECAPIADKLGALLTVHVWRGMSHHTAKHVFVTHTDGEPLTPIEEIVVQKVSLYCAGVLSRGEIRSALAYSYDHEWAAHELLRDNDMLADVRAIRNSIMSGTDIWIGGHT